MSYIWSEKNEISVVEEGGEGMADILYTADVKVLRCI